MKKVCPGRKFWQHGRGLQPQTTAQRAEPAEGNNAVPVPGQNHPTLFINGKKIRILKVADDGNNFLAAL